jgi:hypothetical protein
VTADPTVQVADGSESTITVTLRDSFGNATMITAAAVTMAATFGTLGEIIANIGGGSYRAYFGSATPRPSTW